MGKNSGRFDKYFGKYLFTFVLMVVGLLLFKYIPMFFFGEDILFDASQHLTTAIFVLYGVYLFFISGKKKLEVPYYFFSFFVLNIISLQRIIDNAHNDIGLLLGLCISTFAIWFPRRREFR